MATVGTDDQNKDPSDPSLGRRHFLRQSAVSLGVTVHEFIKHRDASVPQQTTRQPALIPTHWLRPPGAVEESLFLDRCTQCGDCLEVCPVRAIQKHPEDETPILFPEKTSCELCDDFPCIRVCETEALVPVGSRKDVQMGLAAVVQRDCTATHGCHACVSKCPLDAIEKDFASLKIVIDGARCVGCGMCLQTCKAVNDRVAIKVTPHRMLTSQL